MISKPPSLHYHLETLLALKMIKLDGNSKSYKVSMDPELDISLMMDARTGSTGVSVMALVTASALAIVPFNILTPVGPVAEIDSCGENFGSFSYWFKFASKFAPLAHIQMTNTGSSAVSAVGDVVVRYPPVMNVVQEHAYCLLQKSHRHYYSPSSSTRR